MTTEERRIYIVMRRDLGMRRGKEIAQAAHAVLYLWEAQQEPEDSAMPVVVLQAKTGEDLRDALKESSEAGVASFPVHDAGRTEVPSGTMTCAAFGPTGTRLFAGLTLY